MTSQANLVNADTKQMGPKQVKFMELMEIGLTPQQAAKGAGIAHNHLTRYMEHPRIAEFVAGLRKETQEKTKFTRDRVMQIIQEGIDMAKLQGDPAALFRGVSEINRMCGYYEPEKLILELSDPEKMFQRRLDSMSETELLKEIGGEENIIDAEFQEV